jgi:hypothetical protein
LKDVPAAKNDPKPDKDQAKVKGSENLDISEQDISEMMSNAIEQKKQAKFDKEIEKGSKIA